MLIQANIATPSTVLDFPTRDRFVRELQSRHYSIVGISGIVMNLGKVREMCRLVREHSPRSTIVVGGHVAALPGIEREIDADHIVTGEGVRWMREFLGEAADTPIEHPLIRSSFGFRLMGLKAPSGGGDPAATIIPSVGCPMGCNFCATSAFFGGKGRFINFFETGEELFRVMCDAERRLRVQTFFVMDENFLLYKKRALELLALMQQHNKSWSMFVFSSANALRKYTTRQLVELGVSWVWMGLESKQATYMKLRNSDTQALTRELQSHGIHVQGSTIIGLEHHTPDNLESEIEHAVAHDADCHQFMLYTPVPGTPLYAEALSAGLLRNDVDIADIHGQDKFNFHHPHISQDASNTWLERAFARDYAVNGPSLYRIMRTTFAGWKRYGEDADARVRARFARDAAKFRGGYGAALWAMERYLTDSQPEVAARMRDLRRAIEREFAGLTPLIDGAAGRVLLYAARREAAKYPAGRRLEPATFVDHRGLFPRRPGPFGPGVIGR